MRQYFIACNIIYTPSSNYMHVLQITNQNSFLFIFNCDIFIEHYTGGRRGGLGGICPLNVTVCLNGIAGV